MKKLLTVQYIFCKVPTHFCDAYNDMQLTFAANVSALLQPP